MEEQEEAMVMQGVMASQREIFSISGPTHITSLDWNNSYHRMSLGASLVQGVYISERDRQQGRVGSNAQAPPWWDFFSFHPIEVLVDEADNSIYGAVYESKHSTYSYYDPNPQETAPRFVIAFRGTITKPHSRSRDLKLDFHCIRDSLHHSSRFLHAMQVVQTMVAKFGPGSIWLTGHSLGAAMALLAGKTMTKTGYPVETYLFNPPFSSIPVEKIKNDTIKHGIRFTGSILKAGIAVAVKGRNKKVQEDEPFLQLASWVPNLFVNPADPICSEYIGYFDHRKKMEDIGAGKIERIATKNSLRRLVSGGSDSEPLHLLPSAYLTINKSKSPDFKRAHGIHQWWASEFNGKYVLHRFK